MFVSIVLIGHPLNYLNPMWNQANRTMISTSMGSVTVMTQNTRKGHFWKYEDSQEYYGPFKNYGYLMDDCIKYSEHGTINADLIKY